MGLYKGLQRGSNNTHSAFLFVTASCKRSEINLHHGHLRLGK